MPQLYGTWTGLCDRKVLIALGSLPDKRNCLSLPSLSVRFQQALTNPTRPWRLLAFLSWLESQTTCVI